MIGWIGRLCRWRAPPRRSPNRIGRASNLQRAFGRIRHEEWPKTALLRPARRNQTAKSKSRKTHADRGRRPRRHSKGRGRTQGGRGRPARDRSRTRRGSRGKAEGRLATSGWAGTAARRSSWCLGLSDVLCPLLVRAPVGEDCAGAWQQGRPRWAGRPALPQL